MTPEELQKREVEQTQRVDNAVANENQPFRNVIGSTDMELRWQVGDILGLDRNGADRNSYQIGNILNWAKQQGGHIDEWLWAIRKLSVKLGRPTGENPAKYMNQYLFLSGQKAKIEQGLSNFGRIGKK